VLQLHRQHQFLRLALECAVRGEEEEARKLLGDRRCALGGAALAKIGDNGAGDAQGIEPGVRIEAPVLDGDEGGGNVGRQPGQVDGRAIASAADAQQSAGAIDIQDLRVAPDRRQGGQIQRRRQEREGGDQGEQAERSTISCPRAYLWPAHRFTKINRGNLVGR
jgi:hypothetical protein